MLQDFSRSTVAPIERKKNASTFLSQKRNIWRRRRTQKSQHRLGRPSQEKQVLLVWLRLYFQYEICTLGVRAWLDPPGRPPDRKIRFQMFLYFFHTFAFPWCASNFCTALTSKIQSISSIIFSFLKCSQHLAISDDMCRFVHRIC